jgi:anti-sigma factor RsiW
MSHDCRRIEALLPPYVDGAARREDVALVDAHLAACRDCHARVHAERTARAVIRARAAELMPLAPPGLRTRLAATMRDDQPLGWAGRLTAAAAAVGALVLVVAALEMMTPNSSILLAAQLALDHVRCFVVEQRTSGAADSGALQERLKEDYGWSIRVPASDAATGVTLIAARRCPFWLGPYAHLLYRTPEGREVSLYVAPGRELAAEQLSVFGHAEHLWSSGGSAYVLVARGVEEADLARIASYMERRTRSE